METSRLASGALGVMAAVALLAGCGGGLQSSSSFVSSSAQGLASVTYTSVRAPKIKPDHHKSWVSPDVKSAHRLLFISDDSSQDVYIFTMPAMQLKGTLTGFNGPQGMCSDKQGNIWVVNTGTSPGPQVLAHRPLAGIGDRSVGNSRGLRSRIRPTATWP